MSMLILIAPALALLLLLSIVAAPVGSIMLWRSQYFFAEAFAHASVLGLCIAVVFGLPFWLGGIFAVLVVIALMRLLSSDLLPPSTILMMIASTALASVALWVSVNPVLQKNLTGLLFGDILLVGWSDVLVCAVLVVATATLLWLNRFKQIKIAIDTKLAEAEGVSSTQQHWIFMFALSAFTVFGVQSVGALLTSSLLLIPSLAARLWATSPLQMVLGAWLVLVLSISAGLSLSVLLNLPTGPSIVGVMAGVYALSKLSHLSKASA